MPIRVHCPHGCLIRMPANRAGKIVRCPECKATLELPTISDSEQQSGKPIPLHAKIVRVSRELNSDSESIPSDLINHDLINHEESNQEESVEPPVVLPANEFVAESKFLELSAIDQAMERLARQDKSPKSLPPTESQMPVQPPQAKPKMDVPQSLSPSAIRRAAAIHKSKLQRRLASVEPTTEIKPIASNSHLANSHVADPIVTDPHVTPSRSKRVQSLRGKPRSTPAVFQIMDPSAAEAPTDWRSRVEKANADRMILARFFAICIFIVALVNMLPAILHGYQWYHSIESHPLPRWIYLQLFVAALYSIYAIFLFQIPDWSAIRAVSLAMLVIAFVFGLCSTVLLIDQGSGWLATFLGLSFTIARSASIWCVAMLCLATVMAYWGGREAANWRRSEQLLAEILEQR